MARIILDKKTALRARNLPPLRNRLRALGVVWLKPPRREGHDAA